MKSCIKIFSVIGLLGALAFNGFCEETNASAAEKQANLQKRVLAIQEMITESQEQLSSLQRRPKKAKEETKLTHKMKAQVAKDTKLEKRAKREKAQLEEKLIELKNEVLQLNSKLHQFGQIPKQLKDAQAQRIVLEAAANKAKQSRETAEKKLAALKSKISDEKQIF